jgi:hypothetical protein
MKYYIYISDSKVSMLHRQIAQSTGKNREAELGFDIKLLRGHIRESRGIPENSITRLDEVVEELHASELVGAVEDPKQYIGGVLPMTWSTYGFLRKGEESPITFWGFCEKSDYPFTGTVMALAGSRHNLLGQQQEGHAHSHSLTPEMTRWFIENLEDPFEDADVLRKHKEYAASLKEYDVANGAWLAATQASGAPGQYEFVAKLLHSSEWPRGFRGSKTTRILLASPLYVAIAE